MHMSLLLLICLLEKKTENWHIKQSKCNFLHDISLNMWIAKSKLLSYSVSTVLFFSFPNVIIAILTTLNCHSFISLWYRESEYGQNIMHKYFTTISELFITHHFVLYPYHPSSLNISGLFVFFATFA
jgi:hypothetical protein